MTSPAAMRPSNTKTPNTLQESTPHVSSSGVDKSYSATEVPGSINVEEPPLSWASLRIIIRKLADLSCGEQFGRAS